MDPRNPNFFNAPPSDPRSRYEHHPPPLPPPPQNYSYHPRPPPPPPPRSPLPPPRQHRDLYYHHPPHHRPPPYHDPRASDHHRNFPSPPPPSLLPYDSRVPERSRSHPPPPQLPPYDSRVSDYGPHRNHPPPYDGRVFDEQIDLEWEREQERRGRERPGSPYYYDGRLEEEFRDNRDTRVRVRPRGDVIFEAEEGFSGSRDRIPLPLPPPPLRPLPPQAAAFRDAVPMEGSMDLGAVEIREGFRENMYMEGNKGEIREGYRENWYVEGNKGKRKWIGVGNEDGDGFREDYYAGNRGKRKFFNSEWNPGKKPGQKTSAFGRIQRPTSVWSRIEEKPRSCSPNPDDYTHLEFLGEEQPELDSLDLSYKSNALVAKVVVPEDAQMSPEEKGPKVVVSKNRMKMKKVANDRERIVIPIVSSPVVSRLGVTKKPLSSSPPVSNDSDGIKKEDGSSSKPVSDRSDKAIGLFGELGSDATKKGVGSVAEGVPVPKKAIGSPSKLAIGGPKKVIGSSGKPVNVASKKVVGSSRKPVIARSNKKIGSSGKPAGGARSQPSSKKVGKVAPVRKVPAKKALALNSVLSRVTEDCKQEDKVNDKKPTDSLNLQISQPAPIIGTTSTGNISLEQYGSDSNLLQGPMMEMQSIESGTSVNSTMVVTTSNVVANLAHAPVVPTMSGEMNNVEQFRKYFDLERDLGSTSIEHSGAEQLRKDDMLGQGNVTAKEEPVVSVEKIGEDFIYPDISEARVIIDISSDSSPELTIVTSESILPFDDIDTSTEDPSKRSMQITVPSVDEPSSLASSIDAQGVCQETVSGGTVPSSLASTIGAQGPRQEIISADTMASPSLSGYLEDQSVTREGDGSEKQHDRDVSSERDEFEIPNEEMNENGLVVLPSDAGNLNRDLSSSKGPMDKENSNIPILEDSSEVPTKDDRSEIRDNVLPSNLSGDANLLDVLRDQDQAVLNCEKQSYSQLLESEYLNNSDNANNQVEKPNKGSNTLLVPESLLASEIEQKTESDKTVQNQQPISGKAQLFQLYELKKQTSSDARLTERVPKIMKSMFSPGIPRVSLKETGRSSHSARNKNARNKTWRRTDNPSASPLHGNLQLAVSSYNQPVKKQSPKKLGRAPNASYVRKGNSLIREPERSVTLGSKVDTSNYKTYSNPSIERPKTPPLPLDSKLSNCMTGPQKEFSPLISEDLAPVESQPSDLLSGSVDNLNSASGIKSELLTRKRMIYVKHKSNQLIAAPPRPGFGDSATHLTENAEKLSSTSSDLYYMRKKNQLILNASTADSQHNEEGVVPTDNLNSDHGASNVSSGECSKTSLFKKRQDKVLKKALKYSKFSRVWTLGGGQSDKKGDISVNSSKVMPFFFPWKRSTYSKFSAGKATLQASLRPISSISRKLQLTRRRDTIYTVSTDGFSIRKAGVVSIGGSNLKWSKSIERHSKKANEEATLAVAEVERKKRERKRRKSIGTHGKNKNSFMRKSTIGIDRQQGERIFRVGSVRYKMDASKATLIRIPDEQSTGDVDQQSGNNTFVPRRLLIGNDEYIRLGNGNQLVRDPKKLVRILASEKVRWSLHTARLRLVKKQLYCQFFTRFGRCNKTSGKCPYIHDPEKVAICTKFLRGKCTDTNCKLTHKVIPERMPDCSYFLQGLCTNINCPYRHVHVNPKASVCDGFLRGYCANGDECRKKHSYVCPTFEATGKCLQGSKCKLHHPKSKTKTKKKRKLSKIDSNTVGRYFGSKRMKVDESMVVPTKKYDTEKDEDLFYSDGKFAEFVSIDSDSDNEGLETNDLKEANTKESDSDLSDLNADELDELIKPVRIMNRAPNLPNVANFLCL